MRSAETFEKALLAIYDTIGNESGWTQALGLVEEITGSAGAMINLVSKNGTAPPRALIGEAMVSRYDAAVVDEYNQQLAGSCPRLRSALQFPDAPYLCDYSILDERQMNGDPVYEFYTRQDVRYFIGSRLADTADLEVTWSLQRSNRQGHAQAADVELFLRLKPHLQKAVHFAGRFDALRKAQALSNAALEVVPYAFLVLDTSGGIILANAKAETFLERQDGVRSAAGRLRLEDAASQAKLEKIIGVCRSTHEPAAMRVARPSGKLPYTLSVRAVGVHEHDFGSEASVVVILQDLAAREERKVATLKQLFGFTPAEAVLASAIASGHSLASVANLQGISGATARVHLKSIFRKAGVNRQADLVRVIASIL